MQCYPRSHTIISGALDSKVLCDVDSQEPKTVHCSTDVWWCCVFASFFCFSKTNNQFLGFADVELQIVLCAPASEIIDFLPIGTLIFVHNAADDDRVRRLTCDVWEHSHGCRVWTGPGWANSPAGLKCCAIRLRRCDGQSVLSGSRLILEWHQWWSHYCVDCRPLACHPAAVLLCSFQAPLPKISNQSI